MHFEIHAADPERAAKFYVAVFGWEIKKWESEQMEYWMVMTGKQDEPGGINGGMLRRNAPVPAAGSSPTAFVCTMGVDDFDAAAGKILANGGKVAMEKSAIMGMAWQGYFFDTDGNMFGIHQPDKNAK